MRLTAIILSLAIFSAPFRTFAEENLADVYFSKENDDKRIALTFDDGPHYKYTAEILDILAEYDIKATFFVIGKLAETYPELIIRELSEGHEVASHTLSHPHLTGITEEKLTNELNSTEEILLEIAEYRPRLFRPPEGKCGEVVRRVASDLGYEVILWTVDTKDWAHTPTDKIINCVMNNTRPGSIILCHDFIGGDSPTPDALRSFIPKLLAEGYEFVTVSDLLFE